MKHSHYLFLKGLPNHKLYSSIYCFTRGSFIIGSLEILWFIVQIRSYTKKDIHTPIHIRLQGNHSLTSSTRFHQVLDFLGSVCVCVCMCVCVCVCVCVHGCVCGEWVCVCCYAPSPKKTWKKFGGHLKF